MVTLETGGAQQVDKRRDNQLSFLICDSKLDKPVNDLTLKLLRTRVRLPPGPPFLIFLREEDIYLHDQYEANNGKLAKVH